MQSGIDGAFDEFNVFDVHGAATYLTRGGFRNALPRFARDDERVSRLLKY